MKEIQETNTKLPKWSFPFVLRTALDKVDVFSVQHHYSTSRRVTLMMTVMLGICAGVPFGIIFLPGPYDKVTLFIWCFWIFISLIPTVKEVFESDKKRVHVQQSGGEK